MTPRRDATALGVGLLVAYLGQAAAGLQVPWLVRLQSGDAYQLASGGVLFAYLALQWSGVTRHRQRHELLGACAPLVLYAHSSRFAYGYLVWLAGIYLAVGAVGLLHRPIVARRARGPFTWWYLTHITLAMLLVILVGYHILIAIAYE